MKLGWSSYCFKKAMDAGEMSPLDVIQWIADNGGEHMEIASYGLSLIDRLELADEIREKAMNLGLELSNYCMAANLIMDTPKDREAELKRVKEHIDLTHRLGIKRMRCDVVPRFLKPEEMLYAFYEKHFQTLVEGCRELADYAANYGITVAVENHQYCLNASERVQRVIFAVNRSNFKTLVDVGNFLVVDEDPLVGVRNNLPYAGFVHFKDFYIRPENFVGGEGWFKTKHGRFLRGAIVGEGDMDTRGILSILKNSGYSGHISIEFEGIEDCIFGSRKGMENLKALLQEV